MASFIEQQQQIQTTEEDSILLDEKTKGISFSKILHSKIVKCVIFLVLFSTIIPVLVFFFIIDKGYNVVEDSSTCSVEGNYRVPCGIPNLSLSECNSIFCCFDEGTKECYHYLPSKYNYQPSNASNGSYIPARENTTFGTLSKAEMKVTLIKLDQNRLQIILHEPDLVYEENTVVNASYSTRVYTDNLFVEVRRVSTDEKIFTTARGPLIASDGFWEWTFQLSKEQLYGLGEISFKENITYTKVIYKNKNDHNTLPIFMAYINGSFHGAIVEHDGPLEVIVLPSFLVILRSFWRNSISITLSLGPTPAEVMKQQRIGESFVPPAWFLGPHICRRGNTSLASVLQEFRDFRDNPNNTVEYASDCLHEDLLSLEKDATEEEAVELSNVITELRNYSHFLISIKPQIEISENPLFTSAVEMDILYKYNGQIFNGSYEGKSVAFPDLSHESIQGFYYPFFQDYYESDGFVLTSNWPAEDTYEMEGNENFPYLSEFVLEAMSHTIPWNAVGDNGEMHINKHNSYGSSHLRLVENAFADTLLMTASTDYGNSYPIHLENIGTTWEDLKAGIRTVLYNGIFGNPLVSIPVCGSTDHYNKETHETICMRWYIVAATMPIFRISSDWPRRDPTALASGHAYQVAMDAINKRKQLTPYLYSILDSGEPTMRPMFYSYYSDSETLTLDEQYMVGSALLFAHPLSENVTFLDLYLPPAEEVWYEFWGGKNYTELGWIRLHVLETDWITFIAPGFIVPMQMINGDEFSGEALSLAVALKCSSDGCTAAGSVNLGSSVVSFTANATGISVENINALDCQNDTNYWGTVIYGAQIYGLQDHLVFSNFSEFDLCDAAGDTYFRSYFQ